MATIGVEVEYFKEVYIIVTIALLSQMSKTKVW